MPLVTALEDLDALGIVGFESLHEVKPTKATTQIRDGVSLRTAWPKLVEPYLDAEQVEFLRAAVTVSEQRHDGWATVEYTTAAAVMEHLGWSDDDHDPWAICQALGDDGFIKSEAYVGGKVDLRPTYRGVVKATEAIATEWQQRLDDLVEEWETTTVDFKRELPLGTEKQNAEFARDVTALANTKASGRERYLVIGFDDKTRSFTTPVDGGIVQNRLEHILNVYAQPVPDIRLVTFEDVSGAGNVGVVVIRRDPAKLPYTVAKGGGKIAAGSVFVRHGSQVVEPDPDERRGLEDEGRRARGEE
jgi:hypothetical protein